MSTSDCRLCGWNPCVCGSCTSCGCTPCGCTSCVSCGCDPCGCGDNVQLCNRVNLDPVNCTVCNGNTECNIWFEPGPPGHAGKCKLDNLTYEQDWLVLSRVPEAKKDLLRITSDPCLVRLANTTKLRVPEIEDNKRAADRINANTLPYYTVLRGNVDGTPNKC